MRLRQLEKHIVGETKDDVPLLARVADLELMLELMPAEYARTGHVQTRIAQLHAECQTAGIISD